MKDTLRLVILLMIAGVALTLVGGWLAWWFEEERRLKRLVSRVLGGSSDAAIVAKGRRAAAGFRMETDQFVVMAKNGAETLVYGLDAVQGAELVIDHVVAARVFRGETRRPLDKIQQQPEQVTLRLIFNDARHPDFDLDLWHEADAGRRHAPDPAETIHEARTWLSRIDAILRRSIRQRIAMPAPVALSPDMPPWDEDEPEA